MQTFTSLTEEWRPIPGFPDYEVSNMGNVRSIDRYRPYSHGVRFVKGIILKPYVNHKRGGYAYVSLSDRSKHYDFKVHRLVAEAFIPNPEMKPAVNHIDCNPLNNTVDNLEWVTCKENSEWTVKCGRQARPGEKAIIATDPKTGKSYRFKSTKEAERQGHTRAAIWRAITGEYKHHHGLTWKYANAE